MAMHNPPHPGQFIWEVYINPANLSLRKVAEKLNVSSSTFSRLINGKRSLSPEMALRLSKTLGRSPESWSSLQNQYDLWRVKKNVNLRKVKKISI